MIPLEGSS